MTTTGSPTMAEQIQLGGMLMMEATALRQSQAILPMIADQELRQQIESSIQTGKAHLTALLGYAKEHQIVQ